MPPWYTDPNVVGLAYDAAGIFVFGVPAVLLSTTEIASAGESFWDYDTGAMRKLVEQRLDTFIGSVLLVAGFVGQLTSAIEFRLLTSGATVAWLILPIIVFSYIATRKRMVSRQLRRAIQIAQSRENS